MNFSIPYKFYGETRKAMLCRDDEVVLAGPADTGKTFAWLWKLHTLAMKYPGAQLAIVRKVKSDMTGSVLHTFKRDFLEPYAPFVQPYGGQVPQWYDYPNGSRIWTGGMDKPGATLSSERDVVFVCQAAQLTLTDWEFLTRCVTGRGAVMPYTQLVADCNPAWPGHWILARSNDGGPLTRFDSSHRDNPQLYDQTTGDLTEAGERRLRTLQNMTGTRLLRLFHGLWAVPEGGIYDIYDDEKHKVRARVIPHLWPRAVGVDPFGAFVAAVWVAWDEQSGILNVYREYCEPFGVTTTGHAQNMLKVTGGETIFAWLGGGPSERQARMDMNAAGVPLMEPPNVGVWAGIDRVYRLLKEFRLVIHDSCPKLLSEIGGYRRKMRDGQPTENIHDKDAYHMLDALRYVVSWLSAPAVEERVSYNPMRI